MVLFYMDERKPLVRGTRYREPATRIIFEVLSAMCFDYLHLVMIPSGELAAGSSSSVSR